jgi:hypothetical protein
VYEIRLWVYLMIEEMCGKWLILMVNRVEMVTIIHLRIVIRCKWDK